MENQKLQCNAAIQISKTRHEVFEAIVDPEGMSNYFIANSNGRMEEGKNLIWHFPEMDTDVPVKVGKVETDKLVSFYWGEDGKELLVEIVLETFQDATVVKVSEKEMDNDEAGIAWVKGNTEGWANFLACLKAYLEYGINLRKGAFGWRFQ
ncbi:SRPBCC domain-containing protein [Dyadobacter sp. CY323]|uniref:SRPBCC domain-containing protein n=1 Tax=Dyadobacter sp. CY323 TaxID=2907302 RepID=UPI001F21B44B|nr:SRPBCC domain-containing protein [Dyadobacter sp. CY323]MCE6987612.1 SRPBCC domain-containing protein [Dyadobacter sp. CY323]